MMRGAIIGLIVDVTGSIRLGCFSMIFIMLPALPFLFRTNLEKAADQKFNVEKNDTITISAAAQSDMEMFQLVPQTAG